MQAHKIVQHQSIGGRDIAVLLRSMKEPQLVVEHCPGYSLAEAVLLGVVKVVVPFGV